MTGDEEQTCGKGLAQNANLPQHLAQVMQAMADLLDAHTQTLDLTDDNSQQELAAYRRLARQHREIAAALAAVAQEMASYRELPMGRHDLTAMSGQVEPFARLVDEKQRLLSLLQASMPAEQTMLAEMRRLK